MAAGMSSPCDTGFGGTSIYFLKIKEKIFKKFVMMDPAFSLSLDSTGLKLGPYWPS
jgi:hypothetical protein